MGLNGKLVSQMTLGSDVNKFRDQFWYAPHQLPYISPQYIQSIELGEGQRGTPGSIITWNFSPEGKKMVAKEVIEAVEDGEGKKTITYKVIGGDLLETYKAFKFIVDAEAKGEGTVVTVTLEYEKKTEATPEPHAVMDVDRALMEDIDRHLSLVPN